MPVQQTVRADFSWLGDSAKIGEFDPDTATAKTQLCANDYRKEFPSNGDGQYVYCVGKLKCGICYGILLRSCFCGPRFFAIYAFLCLRCTVPVKPLNDRLIRTRSLIVNHTCK